MSVGRGAVVLLSPEPTVGHEQQGMRPCVIVSEPVVTSDERYPLVCVVPISGTPGRGALYPPVTPGPSGLRKPSWALCDQLRSVDKRRIRRRVGVLTAEEVRSVEEGVRLFLGL